MLLQAQAAPSMNPRNHLAIIGSGASSIYLLKHIWDEVEVLKKEIQQISIFEKSAITGMGMPYNPATTDRYNMSNISSEELPALVVSFGDWLRDQDPFMLQSLGIETDAISDSEVYPRLALGRYLNSQYQAITAKLVESGIQIREFPDCEIVDIQDMPDSDRVKLITAHGNEFDFSKVVIATGHHWAESDQPEQGYYTSPWPIAKLLPEEGTYLDFPIGTLGASLSAFDVISSLSHRHGTFVENSGRMTFHPFPGAEGFKIVMHSSHGLLPHLQFDQVEPFREIYRHVDRKEMLALVDSQGFLRLETYFDKVCRPALRKAFEKDGILEMVDVLADSQFGIAAFSEKMTDEHDYDNAFEGMRCEMVEARESVIHHKPIHWKEVMDDLMYTLNFHAELMPAEDHLLLQSKVMPFLMNVIAAMPLPSGNTILALYDAGRLDIVAGKVSINEEQTTPSLTTITVDHNGEQSSLTYRMFIDCSGQKPLELENYPFPSLIHDGVVRMAQAPIDLATVASLPEEKQKHLSWQNGEQVYHIGGVEIDGAYRLIGENGKPNKRIHDVAFPHTSGLRPYSYGLQACSDTTAILVKTWVEEIQAGSPISGDVTEITQIYEEI